jgi:DNA-binding winged helix-turn-helix (wHTH) protein/Flp pilus assembly protein TadD
VPSTGTEKRRTYLFGRFRLDTSQRILERDGALVSIPPKAVDTLVALAEHAGEIVDKSTLMQMVWPDAFVAESSLTKNICVLRKVLDQPGRDSVIQTVAKRGYRLVIPDEAEAPAPAVGWRLPRWFKVLTVSGTTAIVLSVLAVAPRWNTRALSDKSESERLYQIGRHMWSKFDRAEVIKSLAHFEKAAAADPNSAMAQAGIADAQILMTSLGVGRPDSLQTARNAASRALELNRKLAAPHVSSGWVYVFLDFDMQSAEREYRRALQLDPNWAPAYFAYSCMLAHSGRLQEARQMIGVAQRLDPVSPVIGVQAARIEYYDRKYDRSLALLREVLEREPAFPEAHYFTAMNLGEVGRIARAREHLAKAQLHSSLSETDHAWLDSLEGRTTSARNLLHARSGAKADVLLMPAIAAGESRLALDYLERMWDQRRLELLLLKASPRFDSLRAEPRFQSVVSRIWPRG